MPDLHYTCDTWMPKTSLSDLPSSYLWSGLLASAVTLHDLSLQSKFYSKNIPADPVLGAILSGPVGNGRHTTAEALAGTLGRGLLHVRIHGADLDFESPDTALAALNSLKAAFRNYAGVCLLLDEIQECRHSRMIQSHLLRLLGRLQTDQPGKNFRLIIVTDSPDSILSGLRRFLILCHCSAPNEDERRDWLSSQLRIGPRLIPKSVSAKDLAAKTEGFSWHQLQLLHRYLRQQLFWNVKLHSEQEASHEIMQAGQITPEEADEIRKRYKDQNYRKKLIQSGCGIPTESQLDSLLRSLKDQLPVQQPAVAYTAVQPFFSQEHPPVPAAPAASPAPAANEPKAAAEVVSEQKPFDKEAALERQRQHANPEKMPFKQLTGGLSHRLNFHTLPSTDTEAPSTPSDEQ